MATIRLGFIVAAAAAVIMLMPLSAVAQLKVGYYNSTCPKLELIVKSSVNQSMIQSPISAPAALRLFFHDCAVRGCDASIMIVNSTGDDEWRNPDNQSLKKEGFQVILNAKAAVDSEPACLHKVSCADIMALAARESVVQTGGPYYDVELGRYDGRLSTKSSVVLPHVNFTLDQLNSYFGGLGLSQTDMIALSGAHTLGAADCNFFQYRIGTDPTLDPTFASQLNNTCWNNPSGFTFLDSTPVTFENLFFRNLQSGRGLLGSDQVLYSDNRSRPTVNTYASNQTAFFNDFVAAMTKLGRVGVKTAATGEIRQDCRFPNPI